MVSEAQIVARISALPAFPSVLPKVQRLLADERCTVAQLERAIAPDAAITTNLLALVNSAAFGLQRRVESVQQALALLGNAGVVDVVTAAAYKRVLPDELPGYRVGAQEFWTHCSAVAVLASKLEGALTAAQRRAIGGSIFTAALLHDLGKLAIATFLEDAVDETLPALRSGALDFYSLEREALGTDHAVVGQLLAQKWKLPPLVEVVARWHHTPTEAPEEAAVAVAVVHLANALAHSLGLGGDVGELARTVDSSAVKSLEIDAVTVERVCAEALEEILTLGETLREA